MSQLIQCCITPPLANSDHNGLHLLLKWKPTHRQFKLSQHLIWDYKHADFTKACDLIRITDWDSLLHENDIDTSTRNWQKRFLEIMSECIPQRQLPMRHNLPWLNQNIVRCIHKHKAFDSVPQLEATGFHPHILKWVRSYLTRRSHKVVFGGESSVPLPVLSGVPQGSVLGPLLFLIYINDAASLRFSSGTYINLFADDMLLYRGLDSPDTLFELYTSLGSLYSQKHQKSGKYTETCIEDMF